jgi:hypothetical protein
MNAMYKKLIEAANKKILFLPHAIKQMSRSDRMISRDEVREAIFFGEIIENYPNDKRGESCLIMKSGKAGRIIHVVCAPKEDFVAVLTAYLPSPAQWSLNFKERKK